jgi:L-malate glycosyltransferase
LRVLHLDTGRSWRGGQQQVLWLLDGCRELGIVQMLLTPTGAPLAARARAAEIEVIEVSPHALALENLRTLRRLGPQFDLVHAHDAHAHSLACGALPLGGLSRPPIVVSRRVGFPVGSLGRSKYRFPALFIAISEFVRWRLIAAGVAPEKIHVVYDGVRAPVSLPGESVRAATRRRHGAGNETFVLGSLSSFAPEKLLREQLGLLAQLPQSVHLWLGVPGGESDPEGAGIALLAAAQRMGVAERFHIIPVTEDAGPFLAGLDLFLYLSRMEGLGSAILLAMAYQLPVVASEVGGIPEIVLHRRTGVLVGDGFESELPTVIQFLMGSPVLRHQIAATARQFVCAHATSDKMVAQTVVLYRELLQGSDGPPA